ncbi:xyloglucan-specific galacturonosyltransferase 1-like isoform X1 [Haliotis rufescens]|uniref:xyloglucan-specific galacturonosyltransferase 1-like isoform X1 n=2 Tax=Haliotis rufescens TaxID=6454 RepID=UPI00201F464A|nr:xyloglucan-specific galacturonosyltransferase 1-like isoform X1 [Haliotis rufescens]
MHCLSAKVQGRRCDDMLLTRRQRKRLWLVTIVALTGGAFLTWTREETFPHDTGLQFTDDSGTHNTHATEQPSGIRTRSVEDKGQNRQMRTAKKIPKVYIYSLPPKFNKDIETCVNVHNRPYLCFHLLNGGLGKVIYREGEMGVFYTHQFSLEVILHNQLLQSQYRTMNPEEADIFYIPAYLGMFFFCNRPKTMETLQTEMFNIVNAMPYLKQGKPHISTLAKIEREQATSEYPLLQNSKCRDVTYIVIEKEASDWYRKALGLENQRVIVAPYPSYVHQYNSNSASQAISSPGLGARQVLIFLAASDRRSNPFRNIILDQIPQKVVDTTYEIFAEHLHVQGKDVPQQVILNTEECHSGHENITIRWMQKSVFCLQPPGDSPTRKSFYDSIQSGCIPVIFRFVDQNVEYPFQRVLNYTDFTVTIDSVRIETRQELILDILKEVPQNEVKRLHLNVLKVARMLQYSAIDSNASDQPRAHKDALDMIIQEVQHMYDI